MSKGGIGVGSASIVLVFSVLCLTVFTLITFVVAGNDKALADAEAELVEGYYRADALAERILAEIATAEAGPPASILGVDIEYGWSNALFTDTVYYLCPINDSKSLYVELASNWGYYDILSWKMVDVDEWAYDDSMHLWLGDDNLDVFLNLD